MFLAMDLSRYSPYSSYHEVCLSRMVNTSFLIWIHFETNGYPIKFVSIAVDSSLSSRQLLLLVNPSLYPLSYS